MATFDGVTFDEAGTRNGRYNPQHGGQTRHVVHKVPGGSNYFIQVTGKEPIELQLPIQAGSADMASLRSKAQSGTSASLSYSGGAVTARLIRLDSLVEVMPGGTVYQASLTFII